MANGVGSSVALLIGWITLHGIFQMTVTAFSNYRRMAARERSEQGDRQAKNTLKLSDDLPRLHLTFQVCLTVTRILIVTTAYSQIAILLAPADAPTLTIVAVLGSTGLATLILGDLFADALGQAHADLLVGLMTAPTRGLTFLLSPIVTPLLWLSNGMTDLTGAEKMSKSATEEEIMTLVDVSQQSGAIEDDEKEMIYSVLQFGETLVREVMVPRSDITGVPLHATLETAMRKFLDSGHSRIPVYEDEIDNIKGLLYAKDLLRLYVDSGVGHPPEKALADLMRPAVFVPETKRADVLFKEMQTRKTHIAIVVDEYGGTAGIVTLEDLLEEIVGDIKDEYDSSEEEEYVMIAPGIYIVDGSMNLGDLNNLMEIDLPDDEIDSIGGYIYSTLGHVPEVGETLEESGLLVRIESVDNRRIRKVYIAKVTPPREVPQEEETRSRDRDRSSSTDSNPISAVRSAG